MRLRSLLFVPGDRPERMEKAQGLGADALILDLEDSVALSAKTAARQAVLNILGRERIVPLFVRINPLASEEADRDLAAIAAAAPDGFVLPKAEGAASVRELDRRLKSLGARPAPVLPIATETPAAVFKLGDFAEVSQRLAGLTWGAEDLPAAIGSLAARDERGAFTPPYEMVRSLTLFAAHAAGAPAIETVYPDFRDLDGLGAYALRGARDGFTGMMAIHPSQVAVINAAFTPSAETIAKAQRIVDAFAANPGAGVLQLDGAMIDAPHLKQAQRMLGRA